VQRLAGSPGRRPGLAVLIGVIYAAAAEEVPLAHRAAHALLATGALEAAAAELEELARAG
jgi:hypothetical protein